MEKKFQTDSGKQLVIANGENSALNYISAKRRGGFAEMIDRASEMAQLIQGPKALGSSRRTAGIHEAGHAVMAQVTVGRLFPYPHRVRVFQETGLAAEVGEVWLGCVDNPPDAPDFVIDPNDVAGMHTHALRTLAGIVAEQLFAPDDFRLGSSLDEQVAGLLAAGNIAHTLGLEHMNVFNGLVKQTGDILSHNKSPLLHIARWMDKHPKLTGRRLSVMLEGVALPASVSNLGFWGGK